MPRAKATKEACGQDAGENMRTVVAGGAGFIRSHLVKRLLDQGRQVVVVDDFSRGSIQNLNDCGVEMECERIDLRNYSEASRAIERAEVVFQQLERVASGISTEAGLLSWRCSGRISLLTPTFSRHLWRRKWKKSSTPQAYQTKLEALHGAGRGIEAHV